MMVTLLLLTQPYKITDYRDVTLACVLLGWIESLESKGGERVCGQEEGSVCSFS